mgnify:CR=1 FL=1
MTMTMVTETGMLLAILIVHEIIPAVQVAAVDPAHQDWAASGAQAVHVVAPVATPVSVMEPGEHVMQSDASSEPVALVYLPATQSMQSDASPEPVR